MSHAPDAHSGREFCCLPGVGLGIQLCTGPAHGGQRYNSNQHAVIGNAGPPTGVGSTPPALDGFEDPAQRGAATNTLDHHEHYAADDIDASHAFVESLAGMDDDEILAALLGEDHGGEMRGGGVPIALGPQLHRDFVFTSGPVASMLEHGCADQDGGSGAPDGGVPDRTSGCATPTIPSKAPDFSWIMEAAMRSMQLRDDEQDATSKDQQPATTAVDAMILPMRKRTREEGGDDEALSEKKRRVPTEEQPGSPAALSFPVRVPMGATNNAGSSTAATRTTIQIVTAAATAPPLETKWAAVAEPTARLANGTYEIPVSYAVVPTGGLSREPAARAGWFDDLRRNKRAVILAAVARERAAAAVRAAVAAELSPRRRGKPIGGRRKGSYKAKARA